MRLIVCGGRDYQNYDLICSVLDKVHSKKQISMLIEGGANGADSHAAIWAETNKIPRVTCFANWPALGKAAGPVRNKTMLSLCPDGLVAFPGGIGTRNMIEQAEKAGVKVMVVKDSTQ